MYFVSFIVALVLFIIAACLFGRGLVRLYQGNQKARGLISSGFIVGLSGIVIVAIIFGFFNM
jgi:hypothetical protein